ncbi:MAG: Hsp20/alpha crystallin family protein [Acidobacteriaceae bacterium]|jgi:HSP20 family protein|nr:Hsp20/alpha crystallin family protein [Acidobacteriaceae bacterium]
MAKIEVSKAAATADETIWNPWFRTFPSIGNLWAANPFDLMREMSRGLDRSWLAGNGRQGVWSPAIECRRVNGELLVSAELPGLKKEDIKVQVLDENLVLEGERKIESKEEKEGYFRSERSYGKFWRQIPLPEGAKTDNIKASMNEGVLEVKIPIVETKPSTLQIPIEQSA